MPRCRCRKASRNPGERSTMAQDLRAAPDEIRQNLTWQLARDVSAYTHRGCGRFVEARNQGHL